MIRRAFIPDTNLILDQDHSRYCMTSDTLHLSRFMKIRRKDKVLDIGTNNGVLLLIAGLFSKNECIGIDIDENAVHLAKENALLNHLDHLKFEHSSLQNYPTHVFDVVLCNPPYFQQEQHESGDVMNFDGTLSLADLAKNSYRLLKDQGRLFIILKSHRLIEAITLFESHRFALKRIQCIHHSEKHAASSVCLEWRKSASSGVSIDPPVIQKK